LRYEDEADDEEVREEKEEVGEKVSVAASE
jgi:hypothetical protein